MCGCNQEELLAQAQDPETICVGFWPCRHPIWRKRNARWVGAKSRQNTVTHAVWVTHNTEPYVYYVAGDPDEIRETRLNKRQIIEGQSTCGVYIPTVIAGENGGHDWSRVRMAEACINCSRKLERNGQV